MRGSCLPAIFQSSGFFTILPIFYFQHSNLIRPRFYGGCPPVFPAYGMTVDYFDYSGPSTIYVKWWISEGWVTKVWTTGFHADAPVNSSRDQTRSPGWMASMFIRPSWVWMEVPATKHILAVRSFDLKTDAAVCAAPFNLGPGLSKNSLLVKLAIFVDWPLDLKP